MAFGLRMSAQRSFVPSIPQGPVERAGAFCMICCLFENVPVIYKIQPNQL